MRKGESAPASPGSVNRLELEVRRLAMRILVALGGNAIKKADEMGTGDEQFSNCRQTARHLARLIQRMRIEDRLVVTHGNGPQSGNLMVQQDAAKNSVPAQPMDIVGAMTQGQIGYMLQQTLTNELRNNGTEAHVIAVINQVLVDRNDPEFIGENASKPVGNFFTEQEVKEIRKAHPDYIFKKVKPVGERVWRRTVPSPDPLSNVEVDTIKRLVDTGAVVIASGGGGIPVVVDDEGNYVGVEAVIDKDLAGQKLAEAIDADVFLILTDVEKAKINFGTHEEKEIDRMTLPEARKYSEGGHFLPGSMGPKVKACMRFIERGGNEAIITSLDKAYDALEGKTGTHITLK